MSIAEMLLPVFVQVILTFTLLFWMSYLRVSGVRSGVVRADQIALREPNWPKRTLQVQNAYHNQFELPVLFYILVILLLLTRSQDFIYLMLAWIFVALRVLHAYIHVTSNNIQTRGSLFGLSALILAIMWLMFIIRIVVVW